MYCQKCGTKNEDNADYCLKCGVNLQTGIHASQRHERKKGEQDCFKNEQDCFGLPNGGAIAGIIIGVMILIWGLTLWLEIDFPFWYIILIIFGILIVAGALYKITRPKQPSNT